MRPLVFWGKQGTRSFLSYEVKYGDKSRDTFTTPLLHLQGGLEVLSEKWLVETSSMTEIEHISPMNRRQLFKKKTQKNDQLLRFRLRIEMYSLCHFSLSISATFLLIPLEVILGSC